MSFESYKMALFEILVGLFGGLNTFLNTFSTSGSVSRDLAKLRHKTMKLIQMCEWDLELEMGGIIIS